MSDRKYRQKGYQDDRASTRRPADSGTRGRREGPSGRGLGSPTSTVSRCARCGSRVGPSADFEEACGDCGSDLHTCTNCRHFDPSAPMECLRPITARVTAKSKRNRCEEFEPKLVQEFESDSGGSGNDAKAAFDDLFNF